MADPKVIACRECEWLDWGRPCADGIKTWICTAPVGPVMFDAFYGKTGKTRITQRIEVANPAGACQHFKLADQSQWAEESTRWRDAGEGWYEPGGRP